MMCLGLFLFMFPVLGVCELFGSVGIVRSFKFGKIVVTISSDFSHLPVFMFGYSHHMFIRPPKVVSWLPLTPTLGFFGLVSCYALCQCIFFSSVLTMPLIPSSVFFISDIVCVCFLFFF